MMQSGENSSRTFWIVAGGTALCAAIVLLASRFPQLVAATEVPADLSLFTGTSQHAAPPVHPLVELLKLLMAGIVGLLVTLVHKHYHRDRPLTRSLQQAQILLCLSGALMMIIIGNSTARALGIAGGASIIRFRTPVDDPKDAMILFLLMGLGMAVGLGSFAVCALGAVFLCVFLVILDTFGEEKQRRMVLDVVAAGKEFPTEHVHRVLAATANFYEPLRVTHGNEAAVRYFVKLDPTASLAYIQGQLMNNGEAGLKSVSWDQAKDKKD
ncbi:MAG: hypothetical protein FJW40_26570 [Acidobacteria bacterium]|nr:hypothetical protein [Acidobacteriota bacterium]